MKQTHLYFFQKIQRFFLWLWRQKGTPSERARGIAVGVFSGCFPFFGLQTLLGISLASVFRGNHLLAASATWVSNPFTYVPLFWFNYKIGTFFLGESVFFNDVTLVTKEELWSQSWIVSLCLLFGSSIVGLILGFLAGIISYLFFKLFSIRE